MRTRTTAFQAALKTESSMPHPSRDSASSEQARVSIKPKIAHENIDGEIIMLDLGQGLYHTLNDTAGRIWEQVVAHDSPEMILQEFAGSCDLSVASAKPMVADFLLALRRESIIEITGNHPVWMHEDGAHAGDRSSTSWPALETYRDMRAALVLDPIHEVDDSGWPRPKQPVNGADEA